MKKNGFKKAQSLFLLMILTASFCLSCADGNAERVIEGKQSVTFTDVFDTVSEFTVYNVSEQTFREASDAVHNELLRLHRLFDIYTAPAEGKTGAKFSTLYEINGRTYDPERFLHPDLYSLLLNTSGFWRETGGKLNCAMGSVLSLWHACLEGKTDVPSPESLKDASAHTGFDSVRLNDGKVVLSDDRVRFDFGAVAKGYAAESAAGIAKGKGCTQFSLNLGGNVLLSGEKPTGKWTIGIQNPFGEGIFTKVKVKDCSVVTSGNYQRYREIGGVRYHHIIDPDTCMPAGYYDSVTVICASSLTADMLSTALFCMSEDSGRELAKKYEADVLWIYPDGTAARTEGFSSYES